MASLLRWWCIRTQLATSGPLNRVHYSSITSTSFGVESNEVINFLNGVGKDRVKKETRLFA